MWGPLPFTLIGYSHMNDMIIPFKVIPFVNNTIVVEEHYNEIAW